MGHLGHLKEEYRALVGRLEGGQVSLPEPADPRAWRGWKEILEILYTPEEAELASRLPVVPRGIDRLSARLGIPAAQLGPRLDAMCEKGLVLDLIHPVSGKTKYLLAPPVVGFIEFSMMRAHDGIPKRRMAEALEAYGYGDDTFMREVFGGDTVIGRALVHETALGDDPLPDVLDWERATEVVSTAGAWAVALCYCRHKNAHLGKACDAPQDNCLSLGAGAEFVARRGFGRAVEREEALDILTASRERGLVQIADNVQERPTFICNCCGCCCGQLSAINDFGLCGVNPSGFTAGSDLERCNGCSRCARACPVTAISMCGRRVEAKAKNELMPVVDAQRCIGCGICADTCRKHAMRMFRAERRPHVPRSTLERALRMAIERGHLARLLSDGGETGGTRFLRHALEVLFSLPGAERFLAREQVKSRFVRAALGRIRDPTGVAGAQERG